MDTFQSGVDFVVDFNMSIKRSSEGYVSSGITLWTLRRMDTFQSGVDFVVDFNMLIKRSSEGYVSSGITLWTLRYCVVRERLQQTFEKWFFHPQL